MICIAILFLIKLINQTEEILAHQQICLQFLMKLKFVIFRLNLLNCIECKTNFNIKKKCDTIYSISQKLDCKCTQECAYNCEKLKLDLLTINCPKCGNKKTELLDYCSQGNSPEILILILDFVIEKKDKIKEKDSISYKINYPKDFIINLEIIFEKKKISTINIYTC